MVGSPRMASRFQLRRYQIKPGEMRAWVQEWLEKVRALRAQFGLKVVGSWTSEGDQFVWIISYDGPLTLEEEDRGYYSTTEGMERSTAPERARQGHARGAASTRAAGPPRQ